MFDFDTVQCRLNSNSMKMDNRPAEYPEDILPMWIADMDFQAPDCVKEALANVVQRGIFGYTYIGPDYFEALKNWYGRRLGWNVEPQWLTTTPGGDFALAIAVRTLTKPGDGVLMQPPVYYPFGQVIEKNNRRIVANQLIYKDGKYSIDFEDFEKKIVEENIKLYFLCSPHNPACRVWTRDELAKLGAICKKHGVTVFSDELHCDFAFPDHPHTPFVMACPEMKEQTIIATSPSKSFNLAGLQVTNIWIPGDELRKRFQDEIDITFYRRPSQMAIVACQTAYTGGEEWLEACKAYMRGNLSYVRDFLKAHLPQIRLVEPEGTYFAWLDFSGLGLSSEELEHLIIYEAKLWLDSGKVFGACAEQFQRVVLACPRSIVVEAMDRLKAAVDALAVKA